MTYTVGEGVRRLMAERGDEPSSDELYLSQTLGKSGALYIYRSDSNSVTVVPGPGVVKPEPGHPEPPPATPVAERPTVLATVPGNVAGNFASVPAGVILHGTRSGQNYDVRQEFDATVNYVRAGAAGLGWHVTVGDMVIATHIAPQAWGWNAREHSDDYLAAEFAQAKLGGPITDGQINAFAWWFLTHARAVWPKLPAFFPTHASLPAGIRDGKSDVEPRGQHSVADRILAALKTA